jgi:inner membrane protein
MSPIGHSLVGAAIGVVVLPREMPPCKQACILAVFVVLANLPDVSILFSQGYTIGHSLFVNLGFCIFAIITLRSLHSFFPQATSWRLIAGGSMCCLSHLLLDSFYNHGVGVAVLWPFSNARLALPMPWFGHWPVSPPFLTWETLRISAVEFFIYSPVLIVAMAWRYSSRGKK